MQGVSIKELSRLLSESLIEGFRGSANQTYAELATPVSLIAGNRFSIMTTYIRAFEAAIKYQRL